MLAAAAADGLIPEEEEQAMLLVWFSCFLIWSLSKLTNLIPCSP